MTIPQSSLIVSCQAPVESPLHNPKMIAAMAKAAINQGAKGVRIDTPDHVAQVRQELPDSLIIGLWKRIYPGYEVYITPCFADAVKIAEAGANIIAIDATIRERPQGETVTYLINRIHQELGLLVMADVDTIESAIAAEKAGADFVGTTLYGYTKITENLSPPGYGLLQEMVKKLQVPVICEGGISTPQEAKKALEYGAYSVVVGTAITGIDLKVKAFNSVFLN
ncbi:N-acylglucosamine-6-phosphate 2-epimerase [Rippkaea orientalis PCC 8801]|uniref:Putative N-acetylmannosamine-6-phosphate 2-epimerase n=1 Tax=Rippkaea orientalis (strain PCC 8801 / RF-1) TaxID=41431 RepID=B7K489_RIPO1|nr:N-acetylmannosamine-6-phosphate 2-epimerase [Rippkaea orientalis]ACK67795.1 N-acylglucosamine-6-phosphate 2-epimerase [Rippkaea orientalis PCC 8801]